MSKKVSIREFARKVGVSDVAVGKAIRAGKITAASIDYSNPKRPKIDVDLALKEWSINHDPNYERTPAVSENMAAKEDKPKDEPPTAKDTSRAKEKPAPASVPPPPPKVELGPSLADIKRKTAEVKLHLAAVELKERQGQLVDKDQVYRALFAAGQEMRTALQAIPDRCVDEMLAAPNRNEAHTILYNEISLALERLSDIYKRGLNDKQDDEG